MNASNDSGWHEGGLEGPVEQVQVEGRGIDQGDDRRLVGCDDSDFVGAKPAEADEQVGDARLQPAVRLVGPCAYTSPSSRAYDGVQFLPTKVACTTGIAIFREHEAYCGGSDQLEAQQRAW